MPVKDATANQGAVIRECLALCELDSANDEGRLLLKGFFDGLRGKLCGDTLSDRYVMEAIEHTLRSVNTEIFNDNSSSLVQLAQFLLDAYNLGNVNSSKETFRVQCSAMHALLECLRILHDFSSGGWDPNQREGLYDKFACWCQRVIDVGGHYPAKFQAMMVEQTLSFLRSCKRVVRVVNNARRIASTMHGEFGEYRSLRGVVHLDFDLGKAGSVTRALLQALLQTKRGEKICAEQWRTYLHAMNSASFVAIEDLLAFEAFTELLSSLVLDAEGTDNERCKALRFGVVEMLNRLAVHGNDEAVRGASAETLASFAERSDEWDWSSDPDLFAELLDNLSELSIRGYEHEKRKAREAIQKLASNVHTVACEDALSEWRGGKTVEEQIESLSPSRSHTLGNELFSQVWRSLEDELSYATTGDRSRPKKKHSLISPYIVRYFAGRKEEFNKLFDTFMSNSQSVIIKAIVGPGGIGKTQLAIKVFERLRITGSYENAFWIPSESKESLVCAFLQIAEYLEIPKDDEILEVVTRIHQKLEGSRIVYVFDDALDLELIREYLPVATGHVIVTTRDVKTRGWERDTIHLGPFDECEAWFLAEKFGYTKSWRMKALYDLLDLLPSYPLPLAQFFSMMKHEDVSSPEEWLYKVKYYAPPRREAKIIEVLSAEYDVEGASARVYLFNASVRSISEELNEIGTHALDILTKLAFVDPNGVPIEWVYKWHRPEDGQQFREKTQKSLKLLDRFSHVRWDKEKNQVYIHAETQLLARHLLLDYSQSIRDKKEECHDKVKENARQNVNTIVDSIDQYIGTFRTDTSNRESWTSLARNGTSLLKHYKEYEDAYTETVLTKHIANAYGAMCMFNESLFYNRRALEMCEHLNGNTDHPDRILCITNYAVGLARTGRAKDALSFYKRALEMCERIHGDVDHPDLILCIRNYSGALDRTGRVKEALPFDKRALEMCERLHGDVDHPDLVLCIRNYAIGLERAGRVKEALPFEKRALEMCERLHGDSNHSDLVACIRSYAVGLERTGRDSEALPLYKRALEMCKRLHGDADHPDLVKCIRNYAVGLGRTGRANDALPFYERAFKMCERLHGDADHPDLVACIRNYAVGLGSTGRTNEALTFYKRALEMCERVHCNANHPHLILCVRNYAVGLERTGRDSEALSLYKRALEMCESLHGAVDHPDIVKCMKSYANGLDRAGRVKEALPFEKRALEMCKRLHGDADHPDLVACIRIYAGGLERTGRDGEALPFYKRALEMCKRLHGDADHPDLVQCMRNYANGLDQAGIVNEALAFYKRALEMCDRLYGDKDHPDLVKCMRSYAVGLDQAGVVNESFSFYKRALEMCERLYGDKDHPDLVACIKSYAVGLDQAGIVNESLSFYKRALEMCERLYGDEDHPDLVACIRSYASGLDRAGKVNEALLLLKRAPEKFHASPSRHVLSRPP